MEALHPFGKWGFRGGSWTHISQGTVWYLAQRARGLWDVWAHTRCHGDMWTQLMLEDGYHSPQPSYRTQVPPPHSQFAPSKEQKDVSQQG